jgi:hypothetical protein
VNLENSSSVLENDGDINLSKCKQVKACITSYLLKNSSLTLVNVEEKTSVPHSTLRRIMNSSGNPSAEAVIKIFRSLGFDNELVKYMKDYHPEIATIMALKSSHNQEYEYIADDDRQYFLDEQNFLILSLAYTTSGTTEKEVRYELGDRGLAKLNELIEKGLILRSENGKLLGKSTNFKFSLADGRKRVEYALKYYRPEEAGNINNWLSYQTESLNEEGLKALKSLQQKQFNERKEQIFNNTMYLGNIKVYSTSVSSTFVAYQESGVLE